jgi:hypothetical protein
MYLYLFNTRLYTKITNEILAKLSTRKFFFSILYFYTHITINLIVGVFVSTSYP